MTFQKYIQNTKCTVNKNQHDTIVGIVETTFAMCDVQGWTYLNSPPGGSCRTRNPSIETNYKTRGDPLTEKCIGVWDCSISYCPFGGSGTGCHLPPNAMFYDVRIMYHVRSELNQDNSSRSTIRNDQYMNFEACDTAKPNIEGSPSQYSVEGQKMNNWNNMKKNCEYNIGITNIKQNKTDGGIRISTYLGPQCGSVNYKITNFTWPEAFKQSAWPEDWNGGTKDISTWNTIYENLKPPTDPEISTDINDLNIEDNNSESQSNDSGYISNTNGYLSTNDVY